MHIATIVLCLFVSAAIYLISYFQFKEKGILLNNAYFYASKEERENMDKSLHYRQSGIVFFLAGTIFLLYAVYKATEAAWLSYLAITMIFITIIYAIVSSIYIERKS